MRYRSLGALLAVTALVAGCGSSGTNTSTSSGNSSSSASTSSAGSSSTSSGSSSSAGINVAGAKADLASIVATTNNLGVPKLDGPIPKNKTIDVINCPIAICTEVASGVQQATQVLGWHYRNIAMNSTPAGYLQAWQQIDQSPGNAVVNTDPVVPYSSIANLTAKANVPISSITDLNQPAGLVKSVIASSANVMKEGEAEGNWVVQDAGKPVKTLFVYDPSVSAIASAYPGFRSAVMKNCSACSVAVLKISVAQIGPALAQQVVSYLQANPDVKYVGFGLGDFATGVPAAIKAAGLENQVKLVVRAATPPNMEDVKTGGIAAAFTSEIYESSYWAVNTLLRLMDGKSPEPLVHENIYLFTPSHLPANITTPYAVPGYENQFKQAWGLS
jgi:ribose transport system substrate-binding protein